MIPEAGGKDVGMAFGLLGGLFSNAKKKTYWAHRAGVGEGHNPQQITRDTSEEVAHVAPAWSPDSKNIVFQNLARTKFDVRVVTLDSKQMSWVTNDFHTNIRR